jgi:2-dehydropantoate 2-reductase
MNITIWGAGSVGCFLAAQFMQADHQVCLLGRDRLKKQLQHGLRISGHTTHLSEPCEPKFVTQPSELPDNIDILLVTLKCTAIKENLPSIAKYVSHKTTIIFMQNGIGIKELVDQHLPNHNTSYGIVTFNIINMDDGHFHQATKGMLIFEQLSSSKFKIINQLTNSLIPLFNVRTTHDIQSVQWGKLLLNLNNAINALAGITLLEELSQPEFRQILCASQEEALYVLKCAKIKPARLTASPSWLLPLVLKLPTPIFVFLATHVLNIDSVARSSMQDDMRNQYLTEVDYINGAVVSLGKTIGVETPINEAITRLIHEQENKPKHDKQDITAMELKRLISV